MASNTAGTSVTTVFSPKVEKIIGATALIVGFIVANVLFLWGGDWPVWRMFSSVGGILTFLLGSLVIGGMGAFAACMIIGIPLAIYANRDKILEFIGKILVGVGIILLILLYLGGYWLVVSVIRWMWAHALF